MAIILNRCLTIELNAFNMCHSAPIQDIEKFSGDIILGLASIILAITKRQMHFSLFDLMFLDFQSAFPSNFIK